LDIKIEVSELQKRSLFLATPMFGGTCYGNYTRGIADLTTLCVKYGIELRLHFMYNESLVQRARNYCTDEFLRSPCTHMMFIDADIGFDANDVIALLALQGDDSPYDIIGA